MTELVPCYLQPATAMRLKRLAVLAGTENDAVERLIAFWEAHQASADEAPALQPAAPRRPPVAMWRSSTGDELPIGAKLEAKYKGKTYFAVIEPQGMRFGKELYQSPSAAGRAVKRSVGVTGSSAQTDGRTFWSVRDPSSGRLVSISDLNPRKAIDADELLREIMGSDTSNAA